MSILALICCDQHDIIIKQANIGDNITSLPCISSGHENAKILAKNMIKHQNITYEKSLESNANDHIVPISKRHSRGIDDISADGQTLRDKQLQLRHLLQQYALQQQHYVIISHQFVLKALNALIHGDDLRNEKHNNDRDDSPLKIHFFKLWDTGLLTAASQPYPLTDEY